MARVGLLWGRVVLLDRFRSIRTAQTPLFWLLVVRGSQKAGVCVGPEAATSSAEHSDQGLCFVQPGVGLMLAAQTPLFWLRKVRGSQNKGVCDGGAFLSGGCGLLRPK